MSKDTTLTGRCYCGALNYAATGEPLLKAQCHCRECQYMTGGGPNYFMLIPKSGFVWTKGSPYSFTRSDLDVATTRSFCANCGTHIVNELPGRDYFVLRVGTLDNPSSYGKPSMAIYTIDLQSFHQIPDDLPAFERLPPR